MTDKKNPTAPPDFETARRMLAEPGFFEDGIAEIEALRGQLGDELPNDLLDGARRLYERSKIPVEQITDELRSLIDRTRAQLAPASTTAAETGQEPPRKPKGNVFERMAAGNQ